MEPQLSEKINTLEKKIDAIYVSVEKTRKYFLSMLIVTVVALVLPLLGLIVAIPSFLHTYDSYGSALEGL